MGVVTGGSVCELRRVTARRREIGRFPGDILPGYGALSHRSSSPQHVDHLVDDSRVEGVNTK
jgi:hypothetical protein